MRYQFIVLLIVMTLELSKEKNAEMLENAGNEISKGGRLLLFPEGKTHTEANVNRAKTGAARIMLMALRNAQIKRITKTKSNSSRIALF